MAVPGRYEYEWPRPSVTVDVALFEVEQGRAVSVLLIERGHDPYLGMWALPGGYIEMDEELSDAASRELEEETGVSVDSGRLIQVGAYGGVRRDPRGRTIGVAFCQVVPAGTVRPVAGDDAARARWHRLKELPELAFDHDLIVADSRRRLVRADIIGKKEIE